jgi:hypothetical protein
MIDNQTFKDAILAAAAADPDRAMQVEYFYFQPKWVEGKIVSFGTKPSCLIGHALAACGITSDMMTGMQEDVFGKTQEMQVFFIDNEFDLSPETIEFARLVQGRQDRGMPWGEAVRNA